jgi:hypothetical protein
VKEREEDDGQSFEPGEDSTEASEPSEEAFGFVPLLVEFLALAPGIEPVGLGWDHRNHAQIEHKLPGSIALTSLIHQQRQAFRHRPEVFQQQSAMRSVVVIASRKREGYPRDPKSRSLPFREAPVFVPPNRVAPRLAAF